MWWVVLFAVTTIVWLSVRDRRKSTKTAESPESRKRLAATIIRNATPASGGLNVSELSPDVAQWVLAARAAIRAGHVDEARGYYQKAAYGFHKLTPAHNQQLKDEIATFARQDPFYREGIALVRDAIAKRPGILQSELSREMSGVSREALGYVLYYGEVNNDVVRVKSGRSYRLFLPGQPIPALESDKPKSRTRKPTAKTARKAG